MFSVSLSKGGKFEVGGGGYSKQYSGLRFRGGGVSARQVHKWLCETLITKLAALCITQEELKPEDLVSPRLLKKKKSKDVRIGTVIIPYQSSLLPSSLIPSPPIPCLFTCNSHHHPGFPFHRLLARS